MGQGIQIWHPCFKLIKSALSIHEVITWCDFFVKQGQTIAKICTQGNYGSGNMTPISQTDEDFINYS